MPMQRFRLLLLAGTVLPGLALGQSATARPDGMVLAQNLYNDGHILILPEGHVFTTSTINKLIHFERERGKAFSIHVEQEDDSSSSEGDVS